MAEQKSSRLQSRLQKVGRFILVALPVFMIGGTILSIGAGVKQAVNTTVTEQTQTDSITVSSLHITRVAQTEVTVVEGNPNANKTVVELVNSLTFTNTGNTPIAVRAITYAYRGAEMTRWVQIIAPNQSIILETPCKEQESDRRSSCLAFYITDVAGAPLGFVPLNFPERPSPTPQDID